MKYYFRSLPFLIKPVEAVVKNVYRNFYNICNMVYVPTTQMVKELKECGISRKPLKLWQRGIDLELFNPSKKIRVSSIISQGILSRVFYLLPDWFGKRT